MIPKLTRASTPLRSWRAMSRRVMHRSFIQRSLASSAPQQPQQQQQQEEVVVWSGSLSYASPESDFTALYVSANSATVESEWSQQYSFASPESDFTAQMVSDNATMDAASVNSNALQLQVSAQSATMESEWAQQILLADAQQDVTALQEALKAADDNNDNNVNYTAADVERMMEHMHLISPESALGVVHIAECLNDQSKEQIQQLFAQQNQKIPEALPENEDASSMESTELLLQQMLLSSPESATGYVHAAETLTADLYADLAAITTPLPTTLEQALSDKEHRAIVVTTATAPFRVLHVNGVWEGLCGYSQAEAEQQPIGELLRGPETIVARQMVQALQEHPATPQAAHLVNYTKEGRKFHNHLQVGPLFATSSAEEESPGDNTEQQNNEQQVVEYLVGVLREVDEHNGTSVQRM